MDLLEKISVGLLYEVLKGVEWYKANTTKFVDTIFILHGCNDVFVSEKDYGDFFGDISSADNSLKIYSHIFH